MLSLCEVRKHASKIVGSLSSHSLFGHDSFPSTFPHSFSAVVDDERMQIPEERITIKVSRDGSNLIVAVLLGKFVDEAVLKHQSLNSKGDEAQKKGQTCGVVNDFDLRQ